jgi:putative Holliday junction resolvase
MTDPAARTLLAFDFGEKRTGVAVGQTISATATPLQTISNRDGAQDYETIERLIHEFQADALVVGLPLNMDGTEQATTRMVRNFVRRLEGRFHLPVYLVDERLSSHEAEQQLAGRADKKTGIDAEAACIILTDWMQQNGFKR